MKLSHYLTVLLAIVVLGMVIVWQQVKAVRLGYRMDHLLREREHLYEETRRLEVELLEETRPAALLQHAERLNVPVGALHLEPVRAELDFESLPIEPEEAAMLREDESGAPFSE